MKHLYTWSAIVVIALASVVGDVLISHAMKQVGDVGLLRRRAGLWTVVTRVLGNRNFVLGVGAMAVAFFSLLFALMHDRLRYFSAYTTGSCDKAFMIF